MTPKDNLDDLRERITPLKTALADHDIYDSIRCMDDVRTFMQSHIFAVWDFMSLLKALQRELTCITVPWFPNRYLESRRFINEIVLGEESDLSCTGEYLSHFELYRAAMRECNADVAPIDRFIELLRKQVPLIDALEIAEVPRPASQFVKCTWGFIASGKPHVMAAAFTFGREDVIPEMFRALIADLRHRFPGQLDLFDYYLARHIEIDEQDHTPMALRMMQDLCGADAERWAEATQAASEALIARITLWDHLRNGLKSPKSSRFDMLSYGQESLSN